MVTFMTTFKPFVGDDEVRQRNALLSWLALSKNVEIFVFGSPSAPDDLVSQFRIKNYTVPDWENTGMTRVNDMFKITNRDATNQILAYVNGDIVLSADFAAALSNLTLERFLMVGQRWDTDYIKPIGIASLEEIDEFRSHATRQGELRGHSGMDYFAFPRNVYPEPPPLVPGGVWWDGYMVYFLRKHAIPVIDATQDVLAIHQNHSYEQTSEGKRVLDAGPAARNNYTIVTADSHHRHMYTLCTTWDAQYFLRNGRLYPFFLSPLRVGHALKRWIIQVSRSIWFLCTHAKTSEPSRQ